MPVSLGSEEERLVIRAAVGAALHDISRALDTPTDDERGAAVPPGAP